MGRLLVPVVREAGFDDPSIVAGDPSLQVSGRTIDLWRAADADHFQFIQFNFDKYRAPRFELCFGEVERRGGRWVGQRSACVIPRGKRYVHEWGKPRWCPARFWSARDSDRIVARLEPMIGQIVRYFESGVWGPNLGEMVDHSALLAAFQQTEQATQS